MVCVVVVLSKAAVCSLCHGAVCAARRTLRLLLLKRITGEGGKKRKKEGALGRNSAVAATLQLPAAKAGWTLHQPATSAHQHGKFSLPTLG